MCKCLLAVCCRAATVPKDTRTNPSPPPTSPPLLLLSLPHNSPSSPFPLSLLFLLVGFVVAVKSGVCGCFFCLCLFFESMLHYNYHTITPLTIPHYTTPRNYTTQQHHQSPLHHTTTPHYTTLHNHTTPHHTTTPHNHTTPPNPTTTHHTTQPHHHSPHYHTTTPVRSDRVRKEIAYDFETASHSAVDSFKDAQQTLQQLKQLDHFSGVKTNTPDLFLKLTKNLASFSQREFQLLWQDASHEESRCGVVVVLLYFGVVVLLYFGVVVLLYFGVVVLWCCGVVVSLYLRF